MADKFIAEVAADGTLFQHLGGFKARVLDSDGQVIALFNDAEHAELYAMGMTKNKIGPDPATTSTDTPGSDPAANSNSDDSELIGSD